MPVRNGLWETFKITCPITALTPKPPDSSVLIRGIDTVNPVQRTFAVFGASTSSVSSAPSNYLYANTNTIKAGSANWSLFIPSQLLIDAGLAEGSTAYFAVYPYSTGYRPHYRKNCLYGARRSLYDTIHCDTLVRAWI